MHEFVTLASGRPQTRRIVERAGLDRATADDLVAEVHATPPATQEDADAVFALEDWVHTGG